MCVYFAADDFFVLWESDSRRDFLERCVSAIRKLPECILYAHNGGRFDFHYLLEFANPGTVQIRNGRVVQFKIGRVTLKDSFPLIPFALEEYKKTKIDYATFERHRREKNRNSIISYLVDDCRYLLDLLVGFRDVVGNKDTIGSAAFQQMRSLGIEIQSLNETHDDMFRPYFFGGRVQAFEKGLIHGPLSYFDINSAYPFAMRQDHPHGAHYRNVRKIPAGGLLGRSFVSATVRSKGAIPLRNKDGTLSFPSGEFDANVTGWEIAAGLETQTLEILKIKDIWVPHDTINFSVYVDTFFRLRQEAKKSGDEVKRLAYKYLLNSGYGKFAQNPRDFKEYVLAEYGKNVPGFDWENDFGAISLWSRPSYRGWGFFDVATGASITGYVRAMLWRAICRSRGVVYCDTDAMICRSSRITEGDALGQWKREGGEGNYVRRAAIAGKKLYGLEWNTPIVMPDGTKERHKIASKGARLQWRDLLELCRGSTITWTNDAPTFSINGAHFLTRDIRAT